METATQILHRLTSYEPGREWDDVIDDPRLVLDLKPNDFDRLTRFYKLYADDLPRLLDRLGLDLLPIAREDVWGSAALPPLHEDPIDRLMIAQALREDMTLATHDRAIWRYGPACRLNVWRA